MISFIKSSFEHKTYGLFDSSIESNWWKYFSFNPSVFTRNSILLSANNELNHKTQETNLRDVRIINILAIKLN